MSASAAPTTATAGPTRFLAPPEPVVEADGTKHFEGVTYAAVPGYRPLLLDVWVPASTSPPPLVVWIHGGAWMFGDRRYLPETLRPNQLFEELVRDGLAVATIDYRHALEAKFPAQLHDAKAAIRYLRAHAEALGIDASRAGVWGESAGGHLAALVGLTGQRPDMEGSVGVVGPSSAVDAVVDWYGVADIAAQSEHSATRAVGSDLPAELVVPPEDQLVGGQDAEARAAASPINYVTPEAPPFLLIHGTADTVVSFRQSEQLDAALAGAGVPVRLIPIEGAEHIFDGHNDIDAVVRLSVDYLREALLERRK